MAVGAGVNRVMSAVRRRVSPLEGIMTAGDYWRTQRAPRLHAGESVVGGQRVAYSDPVGFLYSAGEIFKNEVYRFEAATDRPHIIDAGANIGLSVLYFKRLYPRSTVIAYEPDPEIFALLWRNTGHLPGVELRNAAAWTEDTTLTFFKENSLAGSLSVDAEARGERIEVKAERLRDEVARRPIDFLKIDIEGAENDVLFDLADVLGSTRDLFFEYHSIAGERQRLGELLQLVTNAGFRFVINGTHGSDLPFVHRITTGFDLQANVSCVRAS